MDLYEKANEVLAERSIKYNLGEVTRDDYWRYYKHSAIIQEIYRKVLTLISLDQSHQVEEMLEELPDIINYTCFLWDYIQARR